MQVDFFREFEVHILSHMSRAVNNRSVKLAQSLYQLFQSAMVPGSCNTAAWKLHLRSLKKIGHIQVQDGEITLSQRNVIIFCKNPCVYLRCQS